MPIPIRIPSPLRPFAGGQSVVEVEGATVGDALSALARNHSELDARLRDESGRLIARTSHSLNPVMFSVLLPPADAARFALANVAHPGLGHIAATAACLLGFERPTGFLPSLVKVI